MQVDFYQLSRDSAEVALARIAAKALPAGMRLVVVAEDAALLSRISTALWAQDKASFLPNGMAGAIAGGEHDSRQPILLAPSLEAVVADGLPVNGAGIVAFADGVWRDPAGFVRALLLFDEAGLVAAREVWRGLGQAGDVQRAFWKQDGGRWVKAG